MNVMSNFDIVGSGCAWTIRKNGQPIRATLGQQEQAQSRADRLNREARSRERRCMCCAATFLSEGPHNRMCDRCRRSETASASDSDAFGRSDAEKALLIQRIDLL